jgi:hypothetical protein
MSNKEELETLEIPDILLELNGFKTQNNTLSSFEKVESDNASPGRLVEAGVSDLIKNLFKNRRFTHEEVQNLINGLKSIGVSSQASLEQKAQNAQMIEFLESLNNQTKGFVKKPFQKGMTPYWQQLDELLDKADIAKSQGGGDVQLDTLQRAMGSVGDGVERGLNKGFLGGNRLFNMLRDDDKELLQAQMPGVYLFEAGVQKPISYLDFFKGGYANAGGGASNGKIIMADPDAIKHSLNNLSQNIGASSRLRGWLNLMTQGKAGLKSITPIATIGGVMWAFGQGIKHAPSISDYSEAEKVDFQPSNNSKNDAKNSKESTSNGYGGVTNGNNFGGLGQNYAPNNNNSWSAPQPNLPSNPDDWMPTQTSDYYNLVDRKSNIDTDGTRIAQNQEMNMFANIESLDTAAKNVMTILEQGIPGEETFARAMEYIQSLNKKVEPILSEYNQHVERASSDNIQKVEPNN